MTSVHLRQIHGPSIQVMLSSTSRAKPFSWWPQWQHLFLSLSQSSSSLSAPPAMMLSFCETVVPGGTTGFHGFLCINALCLVNSSSVSPTFHQELRHNHLYSDMYHRLFFLVKFGEPPSSHTESRLWYAMHINTEDDIMPSSCCSAKTGTLLPHVGASASSFPPCSHFTELDGGFPLLVFFRAITLPRKI